MTLERGTLLHRRYRIVEILGQGGMGSIYRAMDENLGVDVALKENLFTSDEYARQFRLEAVILANLRHPNLPRVTDHFVIGDQGQYLVMDYIEGEDLRQRMERQKIIPEGDAILIGAAMCDALSYLHTRKPSILHRDIKPGNVKINPEGQLFLVDFGLAKVVQGSQATTTGARAMTPGYSPPEQYGTARTDPRTDIYSLGATLYAALTGIIPEDGLARAMDNADLTPLRKHNPKVSRRLGTVIEKAMAVEPEDRYQTADEFKDALLASGPKTRRLPGEYIVAPPPPFDARPVKAAGGAQKITVQKLLPEVDGEEPPPPSSKRRKKRQGSGCWVAVLSVLLLLGGWAAGAYYFVPNLPAKIMNLLSPGTATSTATALPAEPPTDTPPSVLLTNTSTPTLPVILPPTMTPVSLATPQGGGLWQISFASDRTGVPQIYLVGMDGQNPRPITNLLEGACQPDWSPDGTRLAFTSPCHGKSDAYKSASLYVINADGTLPARLLTDSSSGFDPAWSPDGTRIAFTSARDGRRQIYVLNLKDNSLTRLTDTSLDMETYQPAWSPFNNQIAYSVIRYGSLHQIWTMTDTGQSQQQLARSGSIFLDSLPVWSPNGQSLLFNQRRPLGYSWLMTIRYEQRDSTGTKVDAGQLPIADVHYSPDGFWLVFEGADGDDQEIFIMPAGGGDRQRLTTDPGVDFDPAWRPIAIP